MDPKQENKTMSQERVQQIIEEYKMKPFLKSEHYTFYASENLNDFLQISDKGNRFSNRELDKLYETNVAMSINGMCHWEKNKNSIELLNNEPLSKIVDWHRMAIINAVPSPEENKEIHEALKEIFKEKMD
jgi:hypothetical protein